MRALSMAKAQDNTQEAFLVRNPNDHDPTKTDD